MEENNKSNFMDTSPAGPPPEAPDKSESGSMGTVFLVTYLLTIFVLSLGLLISAWPNAERNPLSKWMGPISADLNYVILVACGGALGAGLHAFRSLLEMLSNRTSPRGWLLWYALRVLVGIPIALMSYLVVRALVLSPHAENSSLNPYGILAASVVVGMFSTQALDKMNTVFSTLFRPATDLEKQLDRLGEALGVGTLDNYQGFVCLSFEDSAGKEIFASEGERPSLNPGEGYELTAWFQPDKPERHLANEIRISDGFDTKIVEFKVLPDSDKISLLPSQETIKFPPKEPSPRVKFTFQAPKEGDPYDIYIEVFQKTRLIHVVPIIINVKKHSVA